ncbi:MAG: 7-carboxy-7-deazaguanine synthase QueE [Burkholderiaceae bacterium]
MFLVNEVFQTIQGEASYTGTPALFLRLQGCPVGCPWCDTKHTWRVAPEHAVAISVMLEKQSDAPTFARMTWQDLVDTVRKFQARHVVITGGEPCCYDLTQLTSELIGLGYSVQVETSGTYPVCVHPQTWVTVSPKIGMPGGLTVLPDALWRANEIKHPVGREQDIDNLRVVLRGANPKALVWLQPLSQSRRATALCIREATTNGWRVSVQTHKFLGVR